MTKEFENSVATGKAVWDKAAGDYEESRKSDPVYQSCIRQIVNGVPTGTPLCLDAGCGTGLTTAILSPKCDVVVAVDYSFESLKLLKSKGLHNVIVIQADIASLPFKDAIFDACICANTVQQFRPHGPQERAIGELHRATKHEGIVGVSVHHYSRSKRRAGWIKEGKPGQAGIDYIYRFSRPELLRLMPGSKIGGVGYYEILWIPFLGSRLQNTLARFLSRTAALLGFGHMLIAFTKNRNPRRG